MLDEDDVKVAADAMKELEMFMPSAKATDSKSSKQRCDSSRNFMCMKMVFLVLMHYSVWLRF